MTAPDLARVLGVPTVYARVNAAELDEWNRRNERARCEYERDPFAGSRTGAPRGDHRLAHLGIPTRAVRTWLQDNGHPVRDTGLIRADLIDLYLDHLEQT